jgi:hypothetical protein
MQSANCRMKKANCELQDRGGRKGSRGAAEARAKGTVPFSLTRKSGQSAEARRAGREGDGGMPGVLILAVASQR